MVEKSVPDISDRICVISIETHLWYYIWDWPLTPKWPCASPYKPSLKLIWPLPYLWPSTHFQICLEPDPIKIISTLKVSSWNSSPRFCTCCQTNWFWPLPKMWFRYWAMAFEITNQNTSFYTSDRWVNYLPMRLEHFYKAIKGPSNAWYARICCSWSLGIWTSWSWGWHVVDWGHYLYSSFWLFSISRYVSPLRPRSFWILKFTEISARSVFGYADLNLDLIRMWTWLC